MGAESSVRPQAVPFEAEGFGHIQHNGRGKYVLGTGKFDDFFPRMALDIGGVDNGEPPAVQPLVGDIVKAVKGGGSGALIGFIIGHEAPEIVGT